MLSGTALEFLGRNGARDHRMSSAGAPAVRTDEAFALEQDAADPLASNRARFHIPVGPDGTPRVYLAGQSLGAQPLTARDAVDAEMEAWARYGVEAHFHEGATWVSFDEPLREPTARLVGALPDEVSTLNTLTVNLHLLLASFFRPAGTRTRILIDAPTFPSDRYAVESQLIHHGLDPADHLIVVGTADRRVHRPDGGSGGRHPRRQATDSPSRCWRA